MTGTAPATSSRRSIESLMEAYQRSDEQAFAELVEHLSPTLRWFFLGPRVTSRHSDDLLQDFWMRVHQARHTYQPGRPLLPWLYAIARYARTDEYRRMARTESHQEIDGDALVDPKSQVRAIEARSDFRALMTGLSPRQREVVLLLKVRGLSLAEAAQATDSTVNAMKQVAHRAYTNLRAMARNQPGGRTGPRGAKRCQKDG